MHVAEVGVPDPDDDDGHGEVGGLDDGLPGVGHVCDDAVRQDQQDEVLLEDGGYKNDQSFLLRSLLQSNVSVNLKVFCDADSCLSSKCQKKNQS